VPTQGFFGSALHWPGAPERPRTHASQIRPDQISKDHARPGFLQRPHFQCSARRAGTCRHDPPPIPV